MDTHRAAEKNAGADFDKLFEELTEGGDYQTGGNSVVKEGECYSPPHPVLPETDQRVTCSENTRTEQQYSGDNNNNNNNNERLHIVIFEDTIHNQATTRKLALRRSFRTNLYKLRRRINLVSDESWVRWLQGDTFKPIWLQLWYQWLGYHRTEIIEPLRQQAFWLCIKKYPLYLSRDYLLRTNHGGPHHLARFLALAVLNNFGHGALARLAVEPEPLHLMWAVMLVIKLAHAPKHIGMPRGGAALLTRPYELLVKAR